MTTSQRSLPTTRIPAPRDALRIRFAEDPDREHLDGGWWPQSRDLAVEISDLAEHFPPSVGRIVRALVSPPDWDTAVRQVPVSGSYLKVGSFPRDDTHLIHLKTSDKTSLRFLVVPPSMSDDEGEEALEAAATWVTAASAGDALDAVTRHAQGADVESEHWADDGGA
jgi:hypothetical protein